jgi:hypothetical protein
MDMTTSKVGRRALIAGAAAAAGMAAIAAPARAARFGAKSGGTAPRDLAAAGAEHWRTALGAVFAAETEAGRVPLRLLAVEPLVSGPARPSGLARDHGFALAFEVPGALRMPAGRTYRLSSAAFDPVHVFFSSGETRLTAIFN